jgi:hypothetical protein
VTSTLEASALETCSRGAKKPELSVEGGKCCSLWERLRRPDKQNVHAPNGRIGLCVCQ